MGELLGALPPPGTVRFGAFVVSAFPRRAGLKTFPVPTPPVGSPSANRNVRQSFEDGAAISQIVFRSSGYNSPRSNPFIRKLPVDFCPIASAVRRLEIIHVEEPSAPVRVVHSTSSTCAAAKVREGLWRSENEDAMSEFWPFGDITRWINLDVRFTRGCTFNRVQCKHRF